MKIVNGVYTFAKIFADRIEDYALAQIQMLCDNEAFQKTSGYFWEENKYEL